MQRPQLLSPHTTGNRASSDAALAELCARDQPQLSGGELFDEDIVGERHQHPKRFV